MPEAAVDCAKGNEQHGEANSALVKAIPGSMFHRAPLITSERMEKIKHFGGDGGLRIEMPGEKATKALSLSGRRKCRMNAIGELQPKLLYPIDTII